MDGKETVSSIGSYPVSI